MSDRNDNDDLVHGVPPLAVSMTSTLVNKTGSWKYIRPVYRDRVAPCLESCPVGIDIEGYMNLLREGRVDDAVNLLLRENPMPATTGRVCDHPCEKACHRGAFDQPVSIHAVERALGDMAMRMPAPVPPSARRHERVAVVGAGPAGLACAWHLAGIGYPVTIFEAAAEPGGVLRYGIPEYRLPKALLAREIDRIRQSGVEILCGRRLGVVVPWSGLDRFDAVFLATGVAKSRAMGITGEVTPGIRAGLDFLNEVNAGGRPAIGRRVLVIGGGNTAIDCARTAVRLGSAVVILYRRTKVEMPAISEEINQALREGVTIEYLAAPAAARIKKGVLTGLECIRMTLGEPDDSGRPRPIPIEGSGFFLPADTVLTATGEEPGQDAAPPDLDWDGHVVRVNMLGGGGAPGLFAGGDLIEQPHTVAHALGSGKRAAIGIDRYLRAFAGADPGPDETSAIRYGASGNLSITRWRGDDPIHREGAVNEVIPREDLNTAHFTHVSRHADHHLPSVLARTGFSEVNEGLPPAMAMAEARRCFNCGVCNHCELCLIFCPDIAITRGADGSPFEVAYQYCKGCGVCANECPRGAIAMTREGL